MRGTVYKDKVDEEDLVGQDKRIRWTEGMDKMD